MRKALFALVIAGCVPPSPGGKPTETADTGGEADTGADADGDGVPDGDDCAPDDAAVHPGATEACNEVDDDCDGAIDEGVTTTWYVDADGDGFVGTSVEACAAPDGAEAASLDCDDAAFAVNPSAVETCGNEVDDDCDGVSLRCGVEGDVAVETAATRFYGNASQQVGYTLAKAGDVDGDGRGDFWVGAWGDGANDYAGAVHLVSGASTGEHMLEMAALARLYGQENRQRVGGAMAGGDDLDGDGLSDGVIGASGAVNELGRAYVVLGAPSGDIAFDSSWPDRIHTGSLDVEWLGAAVATSPDLTGDGIGDVVVGAGGTIGIDAAWILAGPMGGERSLDDAFATIHESAPTDFVGSDVEGVGDLNGDGAHDLVVGAWGWNGGGGALVFHGPVLGEVTLADADRAIEGDHTDDALGHNGTVAGRGDVDGDGLDDFLVGAPWCEVGGEYAGALYLVSGSATATGSQAASASTASIYGADASDYVGANHDLADLDGDGRADVVFTVRGGRYAGEEGGGDVYVFYGPLSGATMPSFADARFAGAEDLDNLGSAVANVGDTNLDGIDDLLLGADGSDVYGDGGGAAYLFR